MEVYWEEESESEACEARVEARWVGTVHAGELGPRGKLGPRQQVNWLNKIGFFLLSQ